MAHNCSELDIIGQYFNINLKAGPEFVQPDMWIVLNWVLISKLLIRIPKYALLGKLHK